MGFGGLGPSGLWTYTELDFGVLEALDFEPRCEGSNHGRPEDWSHDDGPAKWLLEATCPDCGRESVVMICDRRHSYFAHMNEVGCMVCDIPYTLEEYGVKFTKL